MAAAATTSNAPSPLQTSTQQGGQSAFARRRWLIVVIEIAWVVLFGLYVGREFLNFDPEMRIHGRELEWVTSPVAYVAHVWQTDGYIPRWNPFLNRGQPTVDLGYSMMFNPVASVPSLMLGTNTGTKLSVVLLLMVGGAGGIVLGHTLGWGLPARLLLAGLLIARGSTHATFGFGYPQLAGQQMYFPWIMAGVIGMAKGIRPRVSVAVTAVSLSQTFLTGNVYFILPATALASILVVWFAVRLRPRLTIDTRLLLRALTSFLFAGGLMAVSAFSLVALYSYIGGHLDEFPRQTQAIDQALLQFFVPQELMLNGVESHFRYVYTVPWWFAVLIFAFLPPIPRLLYRSRDWFIDSRLWWFLVLGFLFFVTMGVGINPISEWLWNTIGFLRQWRYLERMLTVASFLLAVLICLRLDGLWLAVHAYRPHRGKTRRAPVRTSAVWLALTAIALSAVVVPWWVEQNRTVRYAVQRPEIEVEQCVAAMAAARPDSVVTADSSLNVTLWAYQNSGVRLATVTADYDQLGRDSTLFVNDLTQLPSTYYVAFGEDTSEWLARGYREADNLPGCEWGAGVLFNPNAMPFAFSAPVSVFETNDVAQVTSNWSPVEVVSFEPEYHALRAGNPTDAPIAVVAQTIAYPGWQARVNGQPAQLESVGQLLGVILPPNTPPGLIEFIYYPTVFEIGGVITLITSVILILYLLRVDVHVRQWRARRNAPPAPAVAASPMVVTTVPTQAPAVAVAVPEPTPASRSRVQMAIAFAVGVAAAAVTLAAFVAGWLFIRRRPPAD